METKPAPDVDAAIERLSVSANKIADDRNTLLAALKTVRRIIGDSNMTFDQLARARMLADDIARGAIAKAEGRP